MLVDTTDIGGVACADREKLLAAGYKPTINDTFPEVSFAQLQRLAHSLDVTIDSLKAFRIRPNVWEIFYAPEVTKGFKDSPFLPKPTKPRGER